MKRHRNRLGHFVKKARRRKPRKARRVYASRKPRAQRKKHRRRRSINGFPMEKASGSYLKVAMDGVGATAGGIGGRVAGKLAANKLGVSRPIAGLIVFGLGVLVAKKVHKGAGLGMCAAGGELAAEPILPESLQGIGDLDVRDVDMIERAAMRGVEDEMNGDDPLNGDSPLNGDGDDSIYGDDPLNGEDDGD